MGFFNNFFDSTSYKPEIELNKRNTERQNKRLTEKERFDKYENNHIKRFVVNHFIDKNPIKDMTLKDVEILQALYRAGLDVYTEHVIIDKIHMSKKTYDDFIINNHIHDIHSIYELDYEKTYADIYIDDKDRMYKSYSTRPHSTTSVAEMKNIYSSDAMMYFAVIRIDNGFYGLVFRIVDIDNGGKSLIIHPTKYIIGRDSMLNAIKFTAIEGLSQDDVLDIVYKDYSKWGNLVLETKDNIELKVKKVNAYEMIGEWYTYIPHSITLEIEEKVEENG